MNYEAPRVSDLGTVRDLTQQRMNKVGGTPDTLSAINADVVGSFTPVP